MPFSYPDGEHVRQRMVDGAGYGKVAIITGCSSGIGLATTQLFLSEQYQVFGVDINDVDYKQISQQDQARFHFHRADLLKEGQCDEAVRVCIAEYGERISVLANVAGVMDAFEAADTFTDKQWERVIGINLTVPSRLIRAVLPIMKGKKTGSIINVASRAAVSGASAGIAYTAAKHGLLGVTKHTAWRFRNEGIRCNAVLPGGVATNIASSMTMESFDQEGFANCSPVNTVGGATVDNVATIQPMDVAKLILFLASDQSSMINGAAVPVDKAWSAI